MFHRYYIKVNTFEPLITLNILKKLKKINFFFFKKKKLITVIKSPFIFKKTRNQFYFMTYSVFINLTINSIISPKLFENLISVLLKSGQSSLSKVQLLKVQKKNIF